jgi:hypothetical protein
MTLCAIHPHTPRCYGRMRIANVSYDDLTIFVIMPEEGLYNAEISKLVEEVACCYKPDL